MRLKDERGITMLALVIMVIVLTILGAFSINIINNISKTSKDTNNKSELMMVQQAVLARYTKYTLTKDESILVGTRMIGNDLNKLPSQLQDLSPVDYENSSNKEKNYFLLGNKEENNINRLGIENTSNVYIVNYYTGEVMQLETEEVDSSNKAGKYVIRDNIETNISIILKEVNNRYVIKQTEEGELLYTYAISKS